MFVLRTWQFIKIISQWIISFIVIVYLIVPSERERETGTQSTGKGGGYTVQAEGRRGTNTWSKGVESIVKAK